MPRRALLFSLVLAGCGCVALATPGAAATIRLLPLPARLQPGAAITVGVELEAATPGKQSVAITLVLADAAPVRWQVAVPVNESGAGSAELPIQLPAALHRVAADIVAALPSGGVPAVAHVEMVPLPAESETAGLFRKRSVSVCAPSSALEGFLRPAAPRLREKVGLSGLRSCTGDVVILHTPDGERITRDLLSAVAEHLQAGRSVVWFVGKSAFSGEAPSRASPLVMAHWPCRLVPGDGLPDLEEGDFAGWCGEDKPVAAPFESSWPQARLIWAPDAPLAQIATVSGDPAAYWLVYDLFQHALMPVPQPGAPVVLLPGWSDPEAKEALAALTGNGAELDPTRPLLLSADPDTIKMLEQRAPQWTARVEQFLDQGGQLTIFRGTPTTLSFLTEWGLAGPQFRAAARGAEVALEPCALLWGLSDPAVSVLSRASGKGPLIEYCFASADGSLEAVSRLPAGKGAVVLCQFDPTRAEDGGAIAKRLAQCVPVM
jgi:hypothetical protein